MTVEVLLDDEAHLDDLRAAFRVEVHEAGRRLDDLLLVRLGIIRPKVERLVERGRVRVGGRAVLGGAPRVGAGEVVAVLGERARPELLPERIPLLVLHEDADLLVIDKPAGMVVVPDPWHRAGTLANALRGLGRPLSTVEGVLRPGIVHRLDAGTSGAMLVAKHDEVHRRLAGLFLAHEVQRIYLAVVRGWPPWEEQVVDAPIGLRPSGRKGRAVVDGGRPARTTFRVRARLSSAFCEGLALVEAIPFTGRTHQIRVHLAFLGHPILGDTLYGGGTAAAHLAHRHGVRRPLLHSVRVRLPGLDVSAPFGDRILGASLLK